MKMTKLFSHTLRTAPASCETNGYKLLVRAGFIKQLGSGVFDLLPIGLRSIRKIEGIIREEINNIGGQEVLFPVVNPAEIWKKTNRFYSIKSELTRFKDRNSKDMVLAMTHEECATDLALFEIDSYKKMPLLIYQIQTKWRDDPRPRAGLIRVREFTMKDSYSFDKDLEGLQKQYKAHYEAYFKIFKRLGLPCIAVASDSGMMGGKVAHEYMYLSPIGEDSIAICDNCGYTANKQVAKFSKTADEKILKLKKEELKMIKTPNAATIDDLCNYLKIDKQQTAKAVFFTASFEDEKDKNNTTEKFVACMIRGDLDVEESKLLNLIKALQLRPATEEEIKKHKIVPGFGSLIGAIGDFIKIVDDSLVDLKNFVTGANKKGYHYMNANTERDFKNSIVADIASVYQDCLCPKCKSKLNIKRGIEIGNIFQLGTRYSDAFGLTFQDEKGEKKPVIMGSYGIGVGRTLACLCEEYNDEKGLKLPISVAPYQVELISLLKGSETKIADRIYNELSSAGIEVLYDDRDENAGVKFNDSELIGCPIIIKLGNKSLKENKAELGLRSTLSFEKIDSSILYKTVEILIKQQFQKLNE